MKTCMPLNISRILGTTLLMFLLIGVLHGLQGYQDSKVREQEYQERIQLVREAQWRLVESSVIDNYGKAELFAEGIKSEIETNLLQSYTDRAALRYDLDNPSPNAKAYVIFTDAVKGKYLNKIRNDNNDPFVASALGVLSDLSLNCSVDSTSSIRSWQSEKAMHANPYLADKAVQALLYPNDKPIFWEFLPSSRQHVLIQDMDLASLRSVFMSEGLEGLQTYEFLKPVYIRQYEDIFGIADVNNIGIKQLNYKLIVVSGFNIYDVINVLHKPAYENLEQEIRIINRDYTDRTRESNFLHAMMIIVIIFCTIATTMINNYVVAMMRKEDEEKDTDEH